MRPLLLALLALALAPTAQAVPVTLYAHVLSPMQDFPFNTQEPDPMFIVDQATGVLTSTLSCFPNPPASGAFQDYHTMYGWTSPALVEYDFTQDGRPRTYPERGVQADVQLDAGVPMILHWYLSEPDAQSPTPAQPVPTPNVVVRATMRAGDAISIDDAAYDSGPVLAQGRSVPAMLAGPVSQGVEHDQVEGRTVYHFTVPMQIESAVIPRATGFNLRVDVLMDSPLCPDGGVMPNSVMLHSSPEHRPRLELGVVEPLKLEAIHPQFVGDELVVHTRLVDVWGKYDLLDVNASIERPGLPPVALVPVVEVQRTHVHGHYGDDFARTWVWDDTEPAPASGYAVRITATTLQGHTETWSLEFEAAPEQAMPGLPPAVLALALAGLVVVARRRA